MRYPNQREFVVSLAHNVVSTVAPEELPFFAATSEAFLRDPERVLSGHRRGDDVLGSGIDIVLALVSPVALAVATAVYQHLTDKAGDAVVRGGGRLLRKLLRRPKQPTEEPAPPALSASELERISEIVRERARALGLPDSKVDEFVAAVLAALTEDE